MKKYEMIKKLMKEEKEKIVLSDVGIFYVAVGIDAYILHEILGLKLNRYAEDKYKVWSTCRKYRKVCRYFKYSI